MNYYLFFVVCAVGFSGLVAQIILLRELLINFHGNELTLGIILASWLISEAIGVFTLGRINERHKNTSVMCIALHIAFSVLLPFSLYLSRIFKNLIGLATGQGMGLLTIVYLSFLAMLPVAFIHGGLFNCLCKMFALRKNSDSEHAVGYVYSYEIIGTLLGGFTLTYFFIPLYSSFQIVLCVSLCTLIVAFPLLRLLPERSAAQRWKALLFSSAVLAALFFVKEKDNYLHNLSLKLQWKPNQIVGYRNSMYGNLVTIKENGQYTLFYNGLPVTVAPYPDVVFVEEYAHMALLFHPSPKNVLVIGSAAGGLLNEIYKEGVEHIDYVELDPFLIEEIKKIPGALIQGELSDARTKIHYLDGRLFLRQGRNKLYDVILIGYSSPADLNSNRLFTREFFDQASARLGPEGILALWLPGSAAYMEPELKNSNAAIINAMRNVFVSVRVIFGERTFILGSTAGGLDRISSETLLRRLETRKLDTRFFSADYLNYRLDERLQSSLRGNFAGHTQRINRDFAPYAVLEMLIFWNRKFSPAFAGAFASLSRINMGWSSVFVFAIFLAALVLIKAFRFRTVALAFGITATGFYAMLINLLMIFSFQIFHGYAYRQIAVLTSIFLAGIAAGAIIITQRFRKLRHPFRAFLKLEASLIAYACLMAAMLWKLPNAYFSPLFITMLLFIAGFIVGAEFPLANKLFLSSRDKSSSSVGVLYACDLIGGCLAGLLGGLIFLPSWGLVNSAFFAAIVKTGSILLLVFTASSFRTGR